MWIQRDVLITVKAYPEPSARYQETSCAAGITKQEGWIRLYPVRFRKLPRHKQFKKYQLVRMRMTKHIQDGRPESYRPDEESFIPGRVVGTKDGWAERKAWVLPTLSRSTCEIRARQKREKISLGVFRPRKIAALKVRPTSPEWRGRKKATVSQLWFDDLRGKSRIEKIPYEFRYRYFCEEQGCKGHEQKIIDWELMQLYRKLKNKGYPPPRIEDLIRLEWLDKLCAPNKETYFFVGNHSAHRSSFMVLGVFYPPKGDPTLF